MSSSTAKIISNMPICDIAVYSKSRKKLTEVIPFYNNKYLKYFLLDESVPQLTQAFRIFCISCLNSQ